MAYSLQNSTSSPLSTRQHETRSRPTLAESYGRARLARGGGFLYSEAVSDPLGSTIAAVALRRGTHPSLLTLGNLLLGLAGSLLVLLGSHEGALGGELVAGAALWQVAYLFDCSDGQVARASARATALGARLDTLTDVVVQCSVLAAVSTVVAYRAHLATWLLVAFATTWFVNFFTFLFAAQGLPARGLVSSRALPAQLARVPRDYGFAVLVFGVWTAVSPGNLHLPVLAWTAFNTLLLASYLAHDVVGSIRLRPGPEPAAPPSPLHRASAEGDHTGYPLFTIGPVQMDPETLALAAHQLPYFRTEEFSSTVLACASMLKRLVGTSTSSRVALLAASGTGAMEAAVVSTFGSADNLLVINGGVFGRRFSQICSLHGIPYTELTLPFGERLAARHLQRYADDDLTGVLVNAHETSTGQLYDMRLLSDFSRSTGTILLVDAIGTLLADPYDMDGLGIDVTVLSSQKGLALPPGLAAVVATERAAVSRIDGNHPRSLYLDLSHYFKDMERGQTPFTPAQTLVYQLHDKLSRVLSSGIDWYLQRCALLASDFRERASHLPAKLPDYRLSNALTPLMCAGAYDVYLRLAKEHGIYVTPSGGDLKQGLLRVGHLGNLTIEDNAALLGALEVVMAP